MGIVLWMRQPVGVITPQLQRAKRKKQKVSKRLINKKLFRVVVFEIEVQNSRDSIYVLIHHHHEKKRH